MAPQREGSWLSEKEMKTYMEGLIQQCVDNQNITIDLGHVMAGNFSGRTKGSARIFQRLRQVQRTGMGVIAKNDTSITVDAFTANFIWNNNDARGAYADRMGSYFEAAVVRELHKLAHKEPPPEKRYALHQSTIEEIDRAAEKVAKAYTRKLGKATNIKITPTKKSDEKGDIIIDYQIDGKKWNTFTIELKYYQPDATWIKYFELVDKRNFGGTTLEKVARGERDTWAYGPNGSGVRKSTDSWTLMVRTKGFERFIDTLKQNEGLNNDIDFLRYLLRKGRNTAALTKKDLLIGGVLADENGAVIRVNMNELVKRANSKGLAVKTKTGAEKFQFLTTQSPGQIIAELSTSQKEIRSRTDHDVKRSVGVKKDEEGYHWGSTFYLHINRALAESLGTIIK